MALAEGQFDAAVQHLSRAAQAARTTGLLATEAFHLVPLSRVQQLAGSLDDAVETLRRAVASAQSVGLMRVVSLAQVRLGRLLIQAGDVDGGRSAVTAASEWFAASGGGDEAALAECLLVSLDSEQNIAGSHQHLNDLLAAARRDQDAEVQVLCLDSLALHQAVSGEPAIALDFLAEADELALSVAHRVAPQDRFYADRARALLTAASG